MRKYFEHWFVITNERARELNLQFIRNIYGDLINHLNCRSIWKDDGGKQYRVKYLNKPL